MPSPLSQSTRVERKNGTKTSHFSQPSPAYFADDYMLRDGNQFVIVDSKRTTGNPKKDNAESAKFDKFLNDIGARQFAIEINRDGIAGQLSKLLD